MKFVFLPFILLLIVVSNTNFVFPFLHLLLLWTCAFAYTQSVSYFSILYTLLSFWLKVLLVAWIFFPFLHLLLLWTCTFADVQEVSYFSLLFFMRTFLSFWHKVSEVMYFFLFLHLLLLWTCAFTNAQRVSYFSSLLCYFYHSDQKCGEWHEICFSFFPLATSVNLCICWCSGGKLLFTTSCVLFYHSDTKCGKWCTFLSFSTYYFYELVHSLMLSM